MTYIITSLMNWYTKTNVLQQQADRWNISQWVWNVTFTSRRSASAVMKTRGSEARHERSVLTSTSDCTYDLIVSCSFQCYRCPNKTCFLILGCSFQCYHCPIKNAFLFLVVDFSRKTIFPLFCSVTAVRAKVPSLFLVVDFSRKPIFSPDLEWYYCPSKTWLK